MMCLKAQLAQHHFVITFTTWHFHHDDEIYENEEHKCTAYALLLLAEKSIVSSRGKKQHSFVHK
jgi:hypothetical protein